LLPVFESCQNISVANATVSVYYHKILVKCSQQKTDLLDFASACWYNKHIDFCIVWSCFYFYNEHTSVRIQQNFHKIFEFLGRTSKTTICWITECILRVRPEIDRILISCRLSFWQDYAFPTADESTRLSRTLKTPNKGHFMYKISVWPFPDYFEIRRICMENFDSCGQETRILRCVYAYIITYLLHPLHT